MANSTFRDDRKKRVFGLAFVMLLIGIILLFLSFGTTESGIRIAKPFRDVLGVVGTTLISSNIIALLYSNFIRSGFLNEIEETIRKTSMQEEEVRKTGIIKVYKRFPLEKVMQGIEDSQSEVRILTTWIANSYDYAHAITTAVKNAKNRKADFSVKILILDPENEALVSQREVEIMLGNELIDGTDDTDVKTEITTSLRTLRTQFDKNILDCSNVEVRNYAATPVLLMYLYDDTIVYSFMLKGQVTMLGPQVQLQGRNTYLYQHLVEQFDMLWREENSTRFYPQNKKLQ